MTVVYQRPDGEIVTIPSPGMFYNCLRIYPTEALVEELSGRRRQYMELPDKKPTKAIDQIAWVSPKVFRERILGKLKAELRRRGIDPGEEKIIPHSMGGPDDRTRQDPDVVLRAGTLAGSRSLHNGGPVGAAGTQPQACEE